MDWDLWPMLVREGRRRADWAALNWPEMSRAVREFNESMARVTAAINASLPTFEEASARIRAIAEATRDMTP